MDGALRVLAGSRSTAAIIELVFGLFLISGMGFLYLRRRVVGWAILLLRLAVLVVLTSVAVEIHPSLGLVGLLAGWAAPPVVLAHIVSRSSATPPAMRDQPNASAELETLGWFGAAGIGWMSSGRPAIGVTVLLVRFLTLGAGVVFLPLLWLGAADECVSDGKACAGLRTGAILVSFFWLALWLAFPMFSGALLRAASGLGLRVEVPRTLVWIGIGILAFFLVPTLLQWLLVR